MQKESFQNKNLHLFCINFSFPDDDQMGKSHDLHRYLISFVYIFFFFLQLKVLFGHVTAFLSFVLTSSFLGVTLGLKPGSLVIIDPTHANTNVAN